MLTDVLIRRTNNTKTPILFTVTEADRPRKDENLS